MDEQARSDIEALFSIIRRLHAKYPGSDFAASPDNNCHRGRRTAGCLCQQSRHGQGIAIALRRRSQQAEGASRGENVQPGEPKAQRTAEAALPTAGLFSWIIRMVVNKSCGGHRGRCELPQKIYLRLPAHRKSGSWVSCQSRAISWRAWESSSAVISALTLSLYPKVRWSPP